MKKLTALIFLPLSLMTSGMSQAANVPETGMTFRAEGTDGPPVAHHTCTASLTSTSANFGVINLTKPTLLVNPFRLNIRCSAPQKVKFIFRDNARNQHSEKRWYTITKEDGSVFWGQLMFDRVEARAGDSLANLRPIGLYFPGGAPVQDLYRSELLFGKDGVAYKFFEMTVGRAYTYSQSTTPNTGEKVSFSGTFEIEYGF